MARSSEGRRPRSKLHPYEHPWKSDQIIDTYSVYRKILELVQTGSLEVSMSQIMNFEAVRCPLCGSDEGDPLFEWRTRRMVRFPGCSLVYRNPRPAVSDVHRAYAAERMSLEWEERVGDRRTDQFCRFLDSFPERPGRLLDIGCGYGFFPKMAEEKAWKAVGVDLNPKAIDYAKDCLGVNALLGDIRDNCFPDGSFNLVTLWNVLDHVPDPFDLLIEVHRVLKDDGYVFIRIPNGTWQYLNFRVANFLGRLGWGKVLDERPFVTFVFHTTSLSRSTLRLFIEQAGFVSLSIKNSKPTQGDPYLGLSSRGELLFTLIKTAVHGLAQSAAFLFGGRWLIGPSLEAWGRRGKIADILLMAGRKPVQRNGGTEELR